MFQHRSESHVEPGHLGIPQVAEALADLVGGGPPPAEPPTAATLEMAGPERLSLTDMVREYQRQVRDRHRAISVPLPGRAGWLMRHGALLAGGPTFRTGIDLRAMAGWRREFPTRRREGHPIRSEPVISVVRDSLTAGARRLPSRVGAGSASSVAGHTNPGRGQQVAPRP